MVPSNDGTNNSSNNNRNKSMTEAFKKLGRLLLKTSLLGKKVERDFYKLSSSCSNKTIAYGGGEWVACTHSSNSLIYLGGRVPCCVVHCPKIK